ncbi:MAG: serine hydrolase domain-containing protein [Sphingobium sp.]
MTLHSSLAPVQPFAADALGRLDRVTTDFVDLLGNLGALIAIDVEGVGRVVFTAGHSQLDRSRAVHPDDVYQIGSQSKTVTAMVLFMMAREGLLGLDDPVHAYLDLPIDRRITVRHLMMNSSGLGEYTKGLFTVAADPRTRYAPRDLVALALPQGQIFTPGERFDYCNTGWVIAAMIIEAVGGKPYGTAVEERILTPLELKSAAFGGGPLAGEPMRCYLALSPLAAPIETTTALSWAFGAGDGIASAGDTIALYSSLMRPYSPLGISLHDLTAETKKPSATPYFPMSLGTEYGLGLERRAWAGSEVWGHPGSTLACRSSTWIDAARGVAVATAVTTPVAFGAANDDLRYPRAQLFAMALNTAYALSDAAR